MKSSKTYLQIVDYPSSNNNICLLTSLFRLRVMTKIISKIRKGKISMRMAHFQMNCIGSQVIQAMAKIKGAINSLMAVQNRQIFKTFLAQMITLWHHSMTQSRKINSHLCKLHSFESRIRI